LTGSPDPGAAARPAGDAAVRLAARPLPLALEAGSVVHRLAAGETLFGQGHRVGAIYRVVSGRVRLVRRTFDDHLVVLHTARAGELFAEASLFSETYHCDAVAALPSRVRAYPKPTLIAAMRADPMLCEALMARLAHQVQDLRARLELHDIRSARQRVLQYLRLHAGADGRRVVIEGKLQDIAAEIGLTRETLYRTLAGLEADGILARDGLAISLTKSSVR